MKTQDAITLLDRFACALLPAVLPMNYGNMKDAVEDSHEVALEVLRPQKRFHTRDLAESDNRSVEIDVHDFYAGIFHLRGEFHAGGES